MLTLFLASLNNQLDILIHLLDYNYAGGHAPTYIYKQASTNTYIYGKNEN